MKTLSISISDLEFNKFGIKESKLNFTDFVDIVSKELTRQNLSKCIKLAEKYGLSNFINSNSRNEVKAVRKDAKNRNLYQCNYLHINSEGGCIFSAFNAIDYIQASRVPVHTIVEGSAASAGTLISICGVKRYMPPNAHMLIHQLSSECWGKMAEIEDQYNNLKHTMIRIKTIYKNRTSIPDKELRKLLKKDLWLNSDKCAEYNLIDRIWTK